MDITTEHCIHLGRHGPDTLGRETRKLLQQILQPALKRVTERIQGLRTEPTHDIWQVMAHPGVMPPGHPGMPANHHTPQCQAQQDRCQRKICSQADQSCERNQAQQTDYCVQAAQLAQSPLGLADLANELGPGHVDMMWRSSAPRLIEAQA